MGGPPCQAFSQLVHLVRANGYEPRFGNLIPEYERVVSEAQPDWFLMEEVPAAPLPIAPGYIVHSYLLDNRWVGGEQSRRRRISFGTRDGRPLDIEWSPLEPVTEYEPAMSGNGFRRVNQAVLGSGDSVPVKIGSNGKVKITFGSRQRRSLGDLLTLQGFPSDLLDDVPLTLSGKQQAIANGVPAALGRALARAIKRAMEVAQ